MDLEKDFQQATLDVKKLSEKPSNEHLLKLYAYFKQATSGDVSGDRPGLLDFVGGAKYDAWEQIKGLPSDQAMTSYIDLVKQLKSSSD